MQFTLSTYVHEQIQAAGIPIQGVSYNSKEEPHFRIDFDGATEEQQAQAYTIAEDAFSRQDTLAAEAEEAEPKKFTPEKAEALANLLVEQGILKQEQIDAL